MSTGQRKRINPSLLIPFFVLALVFGAMIVQKYRTSREIPAVPQQQNPSGTRTAVLFFVTGGGRLVREARVLEPCTETAACIRDTLDALFSGPLGAYDEAIPESAAINGVRVEGRLAIVDLNQGFATDLPSGSSAEMAAVYSIVDTVCANYPQIAHVQLTIEGNAVPALRHLDISTPLVPDYSLEAPDLPPVPGASSSGVPGQRR
jgi:hypothetical protein